MYRPTLIQHFLRDSAQKCPDSRAVFAKDSWMTFGELEERSNRLASFLIEEGVCRGDRVALLLENSHEYVVSYYGILKAGGVVVALNTEATTEQLTFYFTHSDAVALITGRRFYRYVLGAVAGCPFLKLILSDAPVPEGHRDKVPIRTVLWGDVESASTQPPCVRMIDADLSAIVYTSGSTGEPKGVMLSHCNTVSNTFSITEYLHLTEKDRVMDVLPFYYVYGKTLLNTHVAVGGSVVIDNRFTYPSVVLDAMAEHEVTGFAGVPSTFMILLGKTNVRERAFPALRYVTQAGGHMSPDIQRNVVEAFAPAELFIMYGATELSPRQTYVPPIRLKDKFGSIGVSIPNTEAFVADDRGNPLPPGHQGEIVARGSNVMMGYWKDPEGTDKVLQNGLYRTGDLGKVDEDGFLWVVGRKKDMLKIGGRRVSAKEIEDAILSIGSIHETAVIGVPDEILGEAARAFVVLKNGIELVEHEIRRALQRKLPSYQVPKYFSFLDGLPKNESGKIMKERLKEVAV